MFTPPKTVKFRHRFLPKIKPGKKAKGNNKLNFGDYGLQSKEVKLIGHREIESARKVLSKFIKKIGRIRIVPCFDYSRSKKAVATRMGSGKGSIEDWSAYISNGTVIFELINIPQGMREIALKALKAATYKLSFGCKILEREKIKI